MSAEYGWSDKKILNLTVRRLRQITAAIRKRKFWEDRAAWDRTAWQTRQLASFAAAGYMSEDNSKAIDAAQSIAFDPIDKARIEELEKLRKDNPVDPRFQKEAPVGSFERFMGSMGDNKRWAGR